MSQVHQSTPQLRWSHLEGRPEGLRSGKPLRRKALFSNGKDVTRTAVGISLQITAVPSWIAFYRYNVSPIKLGTPERTT